MELATYFRFVAALVFVLALIGGAAWLARRTGFAGLTPARRGRTRRLGIVEVAAVDSRRRLVLVRRDGAEHLLLVGGASDLVVETGIRPAGDPGATEGAP